MSASSPDSFSLFASAPKGAVTRWPATWGRTACTPLSTRGPRQFCPPAQTLGLDRIRRQPERGDRVLMGQRLGRSPLSRAPRDGVLQPHLGQKQTFLEFM